MKRKKELINLIFLINVVHIIIESNADFLQSNEYIVKIYLFSQSDKINNVLKINSIGLILKICFNLLTRVVFFYIRLYQNSF